MCISMVDIQSATAEIRRGKKKKERRKKPQGKNIMSASATQGGHNNHTVLLRSVSVYLTCFAVLDLISRVQLLCSVLNILIDQIRISYVIKYIKIVKCHLSSSKHAALQF